MVHRIQNRNPGYSDFSNNASVESFNFTNSISSPVTNGANALKLENELVTENTSITSSSAIVSENTTDIQETTVETAVESVVEGNSISEYEQSFAEEALATTTVETDQPSNGLENFGVEEEAPDLFNSEENSSTQDFLTLDTEAKEENSEEDDLEIPAFLRRQKN